MTVLILMALKPSFPMARCSVLSGFELMTLPFFS
jgi:hypothetical protein